MRIYQILNTVTGDLYVGSETVRGSRWKTHLWKLRKGVHHSVHLQRAYVKYGEPAFEFSIIEDGIASNAEMLRREQHYIDTLNSAYNICRTVGNSAGATQSDTTKQKIREGLKLARAEGRWNPGPKVGMLHKSEVSKQKLRDTWARRKAAGEVIAASEATRELIRQSRLGKKNSAESNEKNRQSQLGRKHTEEALQRMRIAQSKRTDYAPASPETKAKMAEAHRLRWAKIRAAGGVQTSDETRAKIRAAALNRPPVSAETRAKQSAQRMGNTFRRGIKLSDEHREALHRGRALSRAAEPTQQLVAS
jgi:group I intron endonuclease